MLGVDYVTVTPKAGNRLFKELRITIIYLNLAKISLTRKSKAELEAASSRRHNYQQ